MSELGRSDAFFLTCGAFLMPTILVEPWRNVRSRPLRALYPNTVGVVVRPGGDIVLVDTGFSAEVCADPLRTLGSIRTRAMQPQLAAKDAVVEQLRRLGLSASRVTTIIATHVHLDHTGGVVDFPNAELVCSAREFEAFLSLPSYPTYRPVDLLAAGRIRIVKTDGPPLHGFRASADLFGDGSVVLLDARGHTKGSVAVRIASGRGTYLHVGDAVYNSWEFAAGERGVAFGARFVAWDLAEAEKSRASIRRFIDGNPTAPVIASHDAAGFDSLPHVPAV